MTPGAFYYDMDPNDLLSSFRSFAETLVRAACWFMPLNFDYNNSLPSFGAFSVADRWRLIAGSYSGINVAATALRRVPGATDFTPFFGLSPETVELLVCYLPQQQERVDAATSLARHINQQCSGMTFPEIAFALADFAYRERPEIEDHRLLAHNRQRIRRALAMYTNQLGGMATLPATSSFGSAYLSSAAAARHRVETTVIMMEHIQASSASLVRDMASRFPSLHADNSAVWNHIHKARGMTMSVNHQEDCDLDDRQN